MQKNFPFTHEGIKYWYSRSVVCSTYIYARYMGQWYVIATLRKNSSLMNVPGGYLDFDETTEECARREATEETGLVISSKLHLYEVDSTPIRHTNQNVVFSYYTNLGELPILPTIRVDSESEWGIWIPVDNVEKAHWISNQKRMIREIFNKKINKKWWHF